MLDIYEKCNLCPRKCNVNRHKTLGFCKASNKIKVSLAKPFFYEEPVISGTNGSGAIFFSCCNLKCEFCQNFNISTNNFGEEITIDRLSEIMLELQEKGCHNINLVTPTMYIPSIKEAIIKAKQNGLTIPIVYNTSSYENVESLKLLEGLIDIYLPDLKYYDDKYAIKYSKSPNYFINATKAIHEMFRQVGKFEIDENGIMKKGVIVRHMMLPTLLYDSKKIIKYLYKTYKDDIFISIMNQYTPTKYVQSYELKNPITKEEYYNLIDYAYDLGINNAFCQEDETVSESFIPEFNLEGIKKEEN